MARYLSEDERQQDEKVSAVQRLYRLNTAEKVIAAIAAGAGDIWATTPRDGALWRIDPKTNAVTRVNFPYMPTGVTADANDVWVTVREK